MMIDDRSIALVTGANRGIGLEVARELAGRGLRVILTSRDPAQGQEAAETLAGEGLDAVAYQLDVANPTSIAALAERVRGDWGHINALINNAGVALDGFDARVVQETLDVNFFGAMRVTDALLPLITEHGRIVMVSSGMGELSCVSPALRARFEAADLTREELVALMRSFERDVREGRHAGQGWPSSAYRVSKLGLNAFTRILGRALQGTSILVNAVCPGWVRTDMGGPSASRSVEEGAETIVWAALLPENGPSGGFFRDCKSIPW